MRSGLVIVCSSVSIVGLEYTNVTHKNNDSRIIG